MPTAPIAAASLVAGYGVAVRSGKRPLGGLVFAAGTAWCVRKWLNRADARTAALLVGVQLSAFVTSHRLARTLGAWPSVLTTAAASGAAAALLADRR